MKSVLISIQPKWCQLIANGRKTVEIRKTKPKLETPFKVYIYCTKAKEHFSIGGGVYATSDTLYRLPTGEIKFGDGFELMGDWSGQYDESNFLNGKVIGEFVCDKVVPLVINENGAYYIPAKEKCGLACMTVSEARKYGNGKPLYAWHISSLVIYDEPKSLSKFVRQRRCYEENINESCSETCSEYAAGECDGKYVSIRPPQSWCYVEEVLE